MSSLGKYVIISDRAAYHRALEIPMTDFQAQLIRGVESVYLARKKVKASKKASLVAQRDDLYRKLTGAGIPWYVKESAGNYSLVFGCKT